MSKTLQILMPMGGLGSRFSKAGFTTPKPLIEVDGRPMFLSAAASIDGIEAPKKIFFVIRQEHVDQYDLKNLIIGKLPEGNITVIPQMTRGAAETAYAAVPELNPDDPLIIMDCDFKFSSDAYNKMAQAVVSGQSDIDAGLLTFESTDPRYSFAETNNTGRVLRTAEKQAISSHAIWGAYFFAKASTFTTAATELLAQPLSNEMKEYYISFLYNIILKNGGKVLATPVDSFASFGTPEEFEAYVGHPVDPS